MTSTTIYSIYKITNRSNSKVYIGYTSRPLKFRISQHKRDSKYQTKKYDVKFYRAIKKYGWNKFDWEVIYQSKDKNHTKNVMETYFITEVYNSYYNGYNATKGGDGCDSETASAKFKKMWKNPNSKVNQPDFWEKRLKEYIVCDPNNNISKIKGIKRFCLDNGLDPTALTNVALGKIKQHKGWQCKFVNDHTNFLDLNKPKYIATNADGETFKIKSLHQFCEKNNLDPSAMYCVIQGKWKQYKGWRCQKTTEG